MRNGTNFKTCLIRMSTLRTGRDKRTTTSSLLIGIHNHLCSVLRRAETKNHEIKTHAHKMFPQNQSTVCLLVFIVTCCEHAGFFELVSRQHFLLQGLNLTMKQKTHQMSMQSARMDLPRVDVYVCLNKQHENVWSEQLDEFITMCAHLPVYLYAWLSVPPRPNPERERGTEEELHQ